MKIKALAAGVLTAAITFGAATTAFAAPPSSGNDDKADAVVGSGSDTTYSFMQRVELLFNQSNGCETDNTSSSPNLGNCLVPNPVDQSSASARQGNWDHDYFVSRYPTGSGAGISQLRAGTADYARSSRGPNATGETDLNFWGMGKDGVAVVTMAGRQSGNITRAQLQGIWNCTITTWDQITGKTADAGKVIEPIGLNPSSGTKSTFQSYLGFDPNAGTCVKKLSSGQYPFENDLKPVLADAGINHANAIWWMSYAEWKSYSHKRQSAVYWQIDGISLTNNTIGNNTWPISRYIYHVAKKATIEAAPGTETFTGAVGGAQGAVREMTRFICSSNPRHNPNDYSGKSNYLEMTDIFSETGFIRVPVNERTNGICRKFAG